MLSNAFLCVQNFVLVEPRTSPPKICKILQKQANFADSLWQQLPGDGAAVRSGVAAELAPERRRVAISGPRGSAAQDGWRRARTQSKRGGRGRSRET